MEGLTMALIDIKAVKDEALKEISDERSKKAKTALVAKLRQLESAKQVVRNIEAEIADLEASIEDGSFTG
jgi:hypothetical protein